MGQKASHKLLRVPSAVATAQAVREREREKFFLSFAYAHSLTLSLSLSRLLCARSNLLLKQAIIMATIASERGIGESRLTERSRQVSKM